MRVSQSTTARLAELSFLAPQVMALRAARIAMGTDSEGLRHMGNEKVQAYWESMSAMGIQMVRAQQEYTLMAMRQWLTAWTVPWTMAGMLSNSHAHQKHVQRSMEQVIEQGMIPVGKRLRSNLRKLGSPKRRR